MVYKRWKIRGNVWKILKTINPRRNAYNLQRNTVTATLIHSHCLNECFQFHDRLISATNNPGMIGFNNSSQHGGIHSNIGLMKLADSLIILIYQCISHTDRAVALSHVNKVCYKLLWNNPSAFVYTSLKLPFNRDYATESKYNNPYVNQLYSISITQLFKSIPIKQCKYLYEIELNCNLNVQFDEILIELSTLLPHVRSLKLSSITSALIQSLPQVFEKYTNHKLNIIQLTGSGTYEWIDCKRIFKTLPNTLQQFSLINLKYHFNEFQVLSTNNVSNINSLRLINKADFDTHQYNTYLIPALNNFKCLTCLDLHLYYLDDDIDLGLLNMLTQLKFLNIDKCNKSLGKLKNIEYLQLYDYSQLHSIEKILSWTNFILNNIKQLKAFNCLPNFDDIQDASIHYLLLLESFINTNSSDYNLNYFSFRINNNELGSKIHELLEEYCNLCYLTSKIQFDTAYSFKSKNHKVQFYQQLKLLKQNHIPKIKKQSEYGRLWRPYF